MQALDRELAACRAELAALGGRDPKEWGPVRNPRNKGESDAEWDEEELRNPPPPAVPAVILNRTEELKAAISREYGDGTWYWHSGHEEWRFSRGGADVLAVKARADKLVVSFRHQPSGDWVDWTFNKDAVAEDRGRYRVGEIGKVFVGLVSAVVARSRAV